MTSLQSENIKNARNYPISGLKLMIFLMNLLTKISLLRASMEIIQQKFVERYVFRDHREIIFSAVFAIEYF